MGLPFSTTRRAAAPPVSMATRIKPPGRFGADGVVDDVAGHQGQQGGVPVDPGIAGGLLDRKPMRAMASERASIAPVRAEDLVHLMRPGDIR